MKKCKRILLSLQGKSKTTLHRLFDEYYQYQELEFYFGGIGYRKPEELNLFVKIPFGWDAYMCVKEQEMVSVENYLLSLFNSEIYKLKESYKNNKKELREKPRVEIQKTDEKVLYRNGLIFLKNENKFLLKIRYGVPLINATSVNGKLAARSISEILECIRFVKETIDIGELNERLTLFREQLLIRDFINKNGYVSFVADGSILPRENGTVFPMKDAEKFFSPKEMRVSIKVSDQKEITGMAIKKGVTVITGGGYSGKSTLMRAIESGIYNHVLGDGREYILTEINAMEIYAEEGRPIRNLNISPFFTYICGSESVDNFSTEAASGSVSQAANVVEAVQNGSKLLLIDEDKSATNFMIRDENMRKLIKGDPMIPYTDRVRELVESNGVSTILVIGSLSEYLSYADEVILMDNFEASCITSRMSDLLLPQVRTQKKAANWKEERSFRIRPSFQGKDYLFFKSVITENARKIVLDDFSTDITYLTSIESDGQLALIAKVLSDFLCMNEELTTKELISILLSKNIIRQEGEAFYSEVRVIDIINCLNRIRKCGNQELFVDTLYS